MEKKAVITSAQLILALIWSRLMLAYTFMPVVSAPPSNQDVWIVAVLSAVYIAVLSLPLLFLRIRYKEVPAVQIAQSILGTVPGGVVVLLFSALSLFCFASDAAMDVVFINATIFPETPPWALLVFILVPIGFAAYHGVGSLGRISTIIVPYIFVTVLMFFFMGLKDMDMNILKPVLADSSIAELNKGGFLTASITSEMLLFFVYGYFLKKDAKIKPIFFLDILLHLVLVLMMLIPTLGVLGLDVAKHAWNPYYMYTKQLKAYEFLYRLESLNVMAWFLGSLLRSSLYCFMASYLLCDLFHAKKSNRFVIPSCILVFILVMIPELGNSETLRKIVSFQVLPYVMLPVTAALPILMVIVYGLKRLFGKIPASGLDSS
jgi:spore germination protein KB